MLLPWPKFLLSQAVLAMFTDLARETGEPGREEASLQKRLPHFAGSPYYLGTVKTTEMGKSQTYFKGPISTLTREKQHFSNLLPK